MRTWMAGAWAFALLLGSAGTAATGDSAFSDRVRTALASENRTPAERSRDANRKPVETLAFLGLRADMDVLELVPGGGWYTQVLAHSLADPGRLSVWIGIERFADRMEQPGLENVGVVAQDVNLEPTDRQGIFELSAPNFGKNAFDAVLTFRNLHNLTPTARAALHRAVFDALRPGGIYGVVDHTRRHMAPDDSENRRRLDPVAAIHEILTPGFSFEAWSDLHYRPDDELRYEVGRRSVTGNTDRFAFLFRKPR